MSKEFTLKSVVAKEEGFYRFTFYCELCNRGFTTGRISAPSMGDAHAVAAKEARTNFNRCHKCEKWVCDSHYNEDVMMCTECAPRNNQIEGGF